MRRRNKSVQHSILLSNPKQTTKNTLDRCSTELLVLHIDVDQGESTILIERSGTEPVWCCIIDGGFGAHRGALIRYLTAFKVRVVDLMICSHFDGDHTKGLTELLNKHAVDNVKCADIGKPRIERLLVRNADPRNTKSSTKVKLLKAANKKKVEITQAVEKAVKLNGARSVLTCLHADPNDLQDENKGSLALRFTFGNFSYYTAGDLPSDLEKKILKKIQSVDAFKCGHHGSANSTPDELLSSAQPMAAFISCGQNPHGHPTFAAIERLCDNKSPVQAVYLTNCIHNRRCVNTDYAKCERSIFSSYFKRPYIHDLKQQEQEFKDGNGMYTYSIEAIKKQITACKQSREKAEDDSVRLQESRRLRVLRGMQRAAEHERKEGLKNRQIGRVGGNGVFLGTIVLHAPYTEGKEPSFFHVVFLEETKQQTRTLACYRHCRGEETSRIEMKKCKYETALSNIADCLNEVLESAKPEDGESEHKKGEEKKMEPLGTPEKEKEKALEIPDTPENYKKHMLHRREAYTRFLVPTVIGLHARKDQEPDIPYCIACHLDFESEEPDFDLISVKDEYSDEPVHLHKFCFRKIFVDILKAKRYDPDLEETIRITEEDVLDLDEIALSNFKWPTLTDWTQDIRARFRTAENSLEEKAKVYDKNYLRGIIEKIEFPKKKKKKKKKNEDSDSD